MFCSQPEFVNLGHFQCTAVALKDLPLYFGLRSSTRNSLPFHLLQQFDNGDCLSQGVVYCLQLGKPRHYRIFRSAAPTECTKFNGVNGVGAVIQKKSNEKKKDSRFHVLYPCIVKMRTFLTRPTSK